MFWKRTIWWILLGIVVLAFLAIGGITIYRVGFAQGAVSEITLPEGNEIYLMPHRIVPRPGYYYPRAGLGGFFPLLFCLGSFFLLMLMFGFGRRHYWVHRDKEYWKNHPWPHRHWPGAPWGPGKPPWVEDQPKTESATPPAEADESES